MDVIGAAMLRVTDAHVGGRILLALSLFAPVIGVVVYHRVVFGPYSYWSLASGLTAYNGAFFLGFMNFLLSLGLALIGGAAWIALRRQKWVLGRIVVGASAAVLIFFCHIFGVFLFALLIGGDEVDRLWELSKLRRAHAARCRVRRWYARRGYKSGDSALFFEPLGRGDRIAGEWRGLGKLWMTFAPS